MLFNLYVRSKGWTSDNVLTRSLDSDETHVIRELRKEVMWATLRLHACVTANTNWLQQYQVSKDTSSTYHVICSECLSLLNIKVRNTFNHWADCPKLAEKHGQEFKKAAKRLQALFNLYKQNTTNHETWTDLLHVHYIVQLTAELSPKASGTILTTEEWNAYVNEE